MEKVIEIKNATVYRGKTPVFTRFSLDIRQGESLAVIGPNGSGKSTLLKVLTRELYPASERDSLIKVLGQEIWNVWELRSRMGIVSSDLQKEYMGDVKGMDVLLSGLYSSVGIWSHQTFTERDREKADDMMEMLGMSKCKEKHFSEMSTGEQRRLMLGRALMHDPEMLILDEPTSGLDLKSCFRYLEILRGLISSGKTVVLVTHRIHEIPPEISRIVLLKNGRILIDGPKYRVITEDCLTRLFDIPVTVTQTNGFYQANPGVVKKG